MIKEKIYVGEIVNTHGIRGDVKLYPHGFDAAYLQKLKQLVVGEKTYKVLHASIQKNMLILSLEGLQDMNDALNLKGKKAYMLRADAPNGDKIFFDEELLGLAVVDCVNNEEVGKLTDVLEYPAHKVYEVKGKLTYLIPAVKGVFIDHIDMDAEKMYVHMMKGLEVDEN